MTCVPTPARVHAKEFHFPLDVRWKEGRTVTASVDGKVPLDVCPPPAFRGRNPEVWSPEDLFVAASASCLAITFTGLAERHGLALGELAVAADGVAGAREDGRFGFTRVLLELSVVVPPGFGGVGRELARQAEESCLVSASFDLPVEVLIAVEERGTARRDGETAAAA
jgi:organic hydroperoxide reductase OsmC/OhrA